jgi:microcystin-dependent protein
MMKNLIVLVSLGLMTFTGHLFPNPDSSPETSAVAVVGAEPFVGEIAMFGGNFAPRGWALCDGQLLPISSNEALFSLLGTTYGGDGRTTFSLPDLRGRAPIHAGRGPGLSDYRLGSKGGQETVTLTTAQMPAHSHSLQAHTGYGDTANPNGAVSAKTTSPAYKSAAPNATMNAAAVGQTGGGQAHENRQPYIAIHYIIALQGVFPSRS